jgi:hypothetical protein
VEREPNAGPGRGPWLALVAVVACGPAAPLGPAAPAEAPPGPTTPTSEAPPLPPPAPPPAVGVVARVYGREIPAAELERHREVTGLVGDEALDDLIGLELVRQAAEERQLPVPPEPWDEPTRRLVERWVADELGVSGQPVPVRMLVDHAWVRDAATPGGRAEQRRQMERLRLMVLSGQPVADAWDALGVDGRDWHVGEQETYPVDVIPEAARSLAPGSVSAVIPGDGGLHLFRVFGRASPDPATALRSALRERLGPGARIERFAPQR